MKIVLIILILVLTSIYVNIDNFRKTCIENGGINPYKKSVPLRNIPKLSSQPIGKLKANAFSVITESSSRWKYYYTLSNKLLVRKKDFNLGYTQICKSIVIKTPIFVKYEKLIVTYIPLWIVILGLILMSIYLSEYMNQLSIKILKFEEDKILNDDYDKKKIYENKINILNSKIHKLENINITSHKLVEDKEMNILNLKNKNKNLENRLNLKEKEFLDLKDNHSVEKTSVEIEKQKKKIEKEFYQLAKKEIYTNYKNNMDEMIETTLDLEKKYNSAVEKALVLGVDLKDSNIDGLVKGRKFELFSATIWNNDKRTLIEDWTPDKGFNENIYIKSNGNPDFSILQNDSHKRVAIECKYRSKFNNKVFTNLGNEKSIKRYNVFQREKNMDVFILLGVEGSSDNPNRLYLIPLKNIEEVRVVDKFYNNFNTTSNKLRKFKVNKNNLIDKIFS